MKFVRLHRTWIDMSKVRFAQVDEINGRFCVSILFDGDKDPRQWFFGSELAAKRYLNEIFT